MEKHINKCSLTTKKYIFLVKPIFSKKKKEEKRLYTEENILFEQ